jgi:hypothetical protein
LAAAHDSANNTFAMLSPFHQGWLAAEANLRSLLWSHVLVPGILFLQAITVVMLIIHL